MLLCFTGPCLFSRLPRLARVSHASHLHVDSYGPRSAAHTQRGIQQPGIGLGQLQRSSHLGLLLAVAVSRPLLLVHRGQLRQNGQRH